MTTEKIRAQDKLAARLFLILHDPFSGRCAVSPMALRCALVGAELAELILNRRVAMANDLIVPGEASAPGTDALSAFVVGAITRQPEPYPVPVRTLDGLHLATVEHLRRRGESIALATYDARLTTAARALGVEIYTP